MKKRLLTPDEIECRVQQTDNKSYATFLLYKDARTDKKILDEKYGDLWCNSFQLINGKLFCTISVYNTQINQWISRSDVGVESNVEKEKGEASDAFKRAGFKWGIGSELYSAPNIKVELQPEDIYNGKCCLKLNVSEIDYNEDDKISKLVLVDRRNRVRYAYHQQQKPVQAPKQAHTAPPQPQPAQTPTEGKTAPEKKNSTILFEFAKSEEQAMKDIGLYTEDICKFYDYYLKRADTWQGKFDPQALWMKWTKRKSA